MVGDVWGFIAGMFWEIWDFIGAIVLIGLSFGFMVLILGFIVKVLVATPDLWGFFQRQAQKSGEATRFD